MSLAASFPRPQNRGPIDAWRFHCRARRSPVVSRDSRRGFRVDGSKFTQQLTNKYGECRGEGLQESERVRPELLLQLHKRRLSRIPQCRSSQRLQKAATEIQRGNFSDIEVKRRKLGAALQSPLLLSTSPGSRNQLEATVSQGVQISANRFLRDFVFCSEVSNAASLMRC